MATSTEAPGIEERYLSAAITSDLTVSVHRHGAADLIVAAGMAQRGGRFEQIGSALIHMKSEWDRCDKPSKRTAGEISVRAAQLKDKRGKPDVRRATVEALVWHSAALRDRAARLSGRSVVIGLLTDWANEKGIDPDLVSPAVFHWLSPQCPACDGLGVRKFKDAPSLTDRKCDHCKGTKEWPRPLGAQAIHDYIKSCIGQAKAGTAQAFYG